ncbi:MAG: hypothetical protein GVY10_01260 [Verrucomicrobia bacterium]|jgi:hypothetical protein|nr:hypothetical protein [Verrucomicrobiota bacterium]
MLERLQILPKPLKIVAWIQIISIGLSLFAILFSLGSIPQEEMVSSFASILIGALILWGILEGSNVVRIIALVLAWLGMVSASLLVLLALPTVGVGVIAFAPPLILTGITIWGLSCEESKAYFKGGGGKGAKGIPDVRDLE